MEGESFYRHQNMTYNADGTQKPPVNVPIDVITHIAKQLDSGCDLGNMALVERSWCYPAQVELFRAVVLKCPVRAQLFVEAFLQNLGPGNPLIRKGVKRLRLEMYVRHIYVDVPENYSQTEFYCNLTSVLPLLGNLRSLYIMMRRWDNHIWNVLLGKYIPEHAPSQLQRLCIQVSVYYHLLIGCCGAQLYILVSCRRSRYSAICTSARFVPVAGVV